MKKIDLYETAIKILGLYLIVIIINQLQEILIYFSLYVQRKNNPETTADFDTTLIFFVSLIGFLILVVLDSLLIFKTKTIANLITGKTDKKEDLKLFAKRQTIFEICLVLLGLITIVFTLPEFIFKLKNHISLVQSNLNTRDYDTTFLITSAIKIGLGIIAIVYSNSISKVLSRKNSLKE